jgi:hypothetical protein
MDSAYKLAIEIVADAKNFETNVSKAGDKVDDVVDKTKLAAGENSKYAQSFGSIAAGVGKFLGIAGGAAAIVGVLKTSIQSIEGPADKFESAIAGGKSALFEMQQAVATMDFSNFFKDLTEGYRRGKAFAEVMDALAEEGAYQGYKGAGLKVKSAELRAMIQDLKYSDPAAAMQASNERRKVEEELMNMTIGFAQKERDAIVENWTGTNKVQSDVAIKSYEIFKEIEEDKMSLLDMHYKRAHSQYEKQAAGEIQSWRKKQLVLAGINEDQINAYLTYQLLSTGEKDGLLKLFDAETKLNNARFEATTRYAGAIRENEMLLERQSTAADKAIQKTREAVSATGLVPTGGISMPRVSVDMSKDLAPGPDNTEAIKKANEELEKQIDLVGGLESTFTSMFVNIDDGFTAMAAAVIDGIKQIAAQLAAKAIVFGIMKMLFPGSALLEGGLKGFLGVGKSLIPGLAAGGIAYGPTIAQVGEYPGARTNPEVITPLSKLKDMIGSTTAVPHKARLQVEVGGSMYAYFDYQKRYLNNYR